MNSRKIIIVAIALIVIITGAVTLKGVFSGMKPTPKKRPDQDIKRYVKVEQVQYQNVTSSVTEEGRVVSGNEVMLTAEASGKLEQGSINLKKGNSFKKGDLLATVYRDEAELALKSRKSNYLNTLSLILPDLKIDFPNAYQSFMTFFNAIDLEKELPKLPQINDSKLKIFLASRKVLSDYYSIKQDEKKLSRYALYAPFNGTFLKVNFEIGTFVNTGSQIARMLRTDRIEVEVPVKNGESKWIKIGDPVDIFTNDNQTKYTGKVIRKSDFIDEGTQSRSIFVRVNPSAKSSVLVGEWLKVNFKGQQVPEVMEMPISAVFNSNEVFTVVDGRLKRASINVIKQNEKTVLFNGLKSGENVVVQSLINVRENTPVEILQK
ncbi:HlyD family efflux transporter periplasmic adaptor subunit [Puteibacter caeruleilacunae]|nr:HlyD family efflux transporter periplasmic adaptor subunit [Puteibacter caeruleilacunae]